MWNSLWNQLFDLSIVAILLRVTVPILLAALGGLISELAGVVNIGLEGLMLISAFFSIAVGTATDSWILGVIGGVIVSSFVSLLMAYFTIRLKVDVIISGFAVNIFGSGFTIFMLSTIYGLSGNYNPEKLNKIPIINFSFFDRVPVLNQLLNGHSLFVWLSFIAIFFCSILLYRTPYGVHLRSVGESPDAALSLGINVNRIHYSALLWSGMFAGLAGAYFSMGLTSMFVKDMTAGTGFLALAVVLFGNRNPIGILFGSLLFGTASTVTTLIETTPGSIIPSQFVKMIPYVATIIALILFALKKRYKFQIR